MATNLTFINFDKGDHCGGDTFGELLVVRTKDNRTFLAKILREARIKKGLSQIDVSKKLGYDSSQFVSNWERSLAVPPVKSLKKIASIYGLETDKLYDMFLKMTLEKVERDFEAEFHGRKKVR